MTAKISFNVQHLYYLPQYLPVYEELCRLDIECEFVFYNNSVSKSLVEIALNQYDVNTLWLNDNAQIIEHYQATQPDWIIFGNFFTDLTSLPAKTKTAMLYHGIGVKDCYYDRNLLEMTVRFVEGSHRAREILRRYPDARLCEVGFAKLDPLFNGHVVSKQQLLERYNLDPDKKTLLYAPTFYPSSLEKMAPNWPDEFADYNIIIKPHEFSLTKNKYTAQRKLLQKWSQYDNVYLASQADYSLIPFMAIADILISEASSALFEFAALNKPVIWCDFLKLRWSYRGPFRYRFNKRMDQTLTRYKDIARHVARYKDLKPAITEQLSNPDLLSGQRRLYTEELIGPCDGKVSERICNYLLSNLG